MPYMYTATHIEFHLYYALHVHSYTHRVSSVLCPPPLQLGNKKEEGKKYMQKLWSVHTLIWTLPEHHKCKCIHISIQCVMLVAIFIQSWWTFLTGHMSFLPPITALPSPPPSSLIKSSFIDKPTLDRLLCVFFWKSVDVSAPTTHAEHNAIFETSGMSKPVTNV